jgi:hypothetical protein
MNVYVFVSCSSVSFRITPVQLNVLITILRYCRINNIVLKTLWTVRGYVQLNAANVKEDNMNKHICILPCVQSNFWGNIWDICFYKQDKRLNLMH